MRRYTSLMIGDNWKNDVEGAKNVGMGNVYYNIKGEKSLPFKPGFDIVLLLKAKLQKSNKSLATKKYYAL